jgi:DNA-binding SARP family transcriptional activator/HAMP domain-containing protein
MGDGDLFVGVLGPLLVQRGDSEVRVGSGKQRLVLGALAVADRALSRDELIDVLWGEEPPATAVGTLQTHVSRLRTSIGSEAVVDVGGGYRLEVPHGHLDSDAFTTRVSEARAARDRGERESARRAFRSALSLWRGPALATFRYEPFAQLEIARLEALRLEVIEDRCELDLDADDTSIVAELEALTVANPFRERLTLLLMRALYRAGRQADALRAAHRLRTALREDLGLDATPEVIALERRILDQDPTLSDVAHDRVPHRRWHAVMERADLPTPEPGRQCDHLTEQAGTMRRSGRLDDARSCAAAAVRLARRLGDHARLGAAALALAGPPEDAVVGEPLDSDLLEVALAGLPSQDPLASMLQARLAVGYIDAGDLDRGSALLATAEAAASAAEDAHAELYVLRARHRSWFDPAALDQRLALDERMSRIAENSTQEDRAWATRWLAIDQLEAGDLEGYDRNIEALAIAADQFHDAFHRWGAVVRRAGRRTSTGPLTEADALTMEALQLASSMGSEYTLAATLELLFTLRWRQRRLDELDDLVHELALREPAARLLIPLLHLELGRHDDARRALHDLTRPGLREVLADTVDVARLTALTALSLAAFHLDDRDAAGQLLDELTAVQATMAVAHPGICILAPVAELRAAVLGCLGNLDEAIAQARTAADLCTQTGCSAVAVRTNAFLVLLLCRRGREGDGPHIARLEEEIDRYADATGALTPGWFAATAS